MNHIWTWPIHFGRDHFILVVTKSLWSSPNQFGQTKTILDQPKLFWSHRRTRQKRTKTSLTVEEAVFWSRLSASLWANPTNSIRHLTKNILVLSFIFLQHSFNRYYEPRCHDFRVVSRRPQWPHKLALMHFFPAWISSNCLPDWLITSSFCLEMRPSSASKDGGLSSQNSHWVEVAHF